MIFVVVDYAEEKKKKLIKNLLKKKKKRLIKYAIKDINYYEK